MDHAELNEWTNETIANLVPDSADIIDNDATFDEDGLDADSLSIVEIMYSVNDEFGIEIEDENIGDVRTVEDLKLYIITHSNEFDDTDAEKLGLNESRMREIKQI